MLLRRRPQRWPACACQKTCDARTEAEEKSILYETWCTILGKKRGLGHHGADPCILRLCACQWNCFADFSHAPVQDEVVR